MLVVWLVVVGCGVLWGYFRFCCLGFIALSWLGACIRAVGFGFVWRVDLVVWYV